jgi:hypothetical protein
MSQNSTEDRTTSQQKERPKGHGWYTHILRFVSIPSWSKISVTDPPPPVLRFLKIETEGESRGSFEQAQCFLLQEHNWNDQNTNKLV